MKHGAVCAQFNRVRGAGIGFALLCLGKIAPFRYLSYPPSSQEKKLQLGYNLSAVALLTIVVAGCTYHVRDLSFVSIEAMHDDFRTENLRVRFSTATNLRTLSEKADIYGIYGHVSLCPFRENPQVSIGRVEHNGIDLDIRPKKVCSTPPGKNEACTTMDDTPDVRAEVASADAPGPFVYEIPFTYNGKQWEDYSADGGLSQRVIPMPPGPQDWCVKMESGAMLGGGVTTNEFRIPKDAIAKALATADIPPHYRN